MPALLNRRVVQPAYRPRATLAVPRHDSPGPKPGVVVLSSIPARLLAIPRRDGSRETALPSDLVGLLREEALVDKR